MKITYEPGDLAVITDDQNCSRFEVGTVVEIVEPAGKPISRTHYLATADPTVRTHQLPGPDGVVCRYVLAENLRPATEAETAAWKITHAVPAERERSKWNQAVTLLQEACEEENVVQHNPIEWFTGSPDEPCGVTPAARRAITDHIQDLESALFALKVKRSHYRDALREIRSQIDGVDLLEDEDR